LKRHDSKSCDPLRVRGFESPPLRQSATLRHQPANNPVTDYLERIAQRSRAAKRSDRSDHSAERSDKTLARARRVLLTMVIAMALVAGGRPSAVVAHSDMPPDIHLLGPFDPGTPHAHRPLSI